MKKHLLLISGIALLLIACNTNEDSSAEKVLKKAELDSLKEVASDVKKKITALEAELKEDKVKIIPVSVITLKPQVFQNFIDVQGKVDAEENIALSTQMPGTITKINIKVGNRVRKGQVLAETNAQPVLQQINALKANADLANQVYERQKGLWDLGIGTEMQLLQAKANKESVDRQMATLQEQLKMSKIISPINGTVDAVNIKLGETAAPGMPSIRVINFSKLKVVAEVAESYADKLKKGAEVTVRFPDMDDSVISKVAFVSRAIKAETRSFAIEVKLDRHRAYYPNMVANLSINDYKSEKPTIVIPIKLILKDENKASFVYIIKDGIAKKQLVKEGEQYKGQSEITGGLNAGDLLIAEGYNMVNDGDTVSVN